ncbi:hypothetical protein QQ054_04795 [Oscillatoria amoena NRMC-F 0135]|nr:hypothetical protein [Oscillatoria amoena NRMC-F 0135]MDL5053476.1 hypothetical protein [Oscillatoria laete-virens NRMC-F 0139]
MNSTQNTQYPSTLSSSLLFFIGGMVSLVAAAVWMAVTPALMTGYYYRPVTIAFMHLIILGFVMSVIMGSLYQLLPVLVRAPLRSSLMAAIHPWLHLPGVIGMVLAFLAWDMRSVAFFGSLVFAGMTLFVLNLFCTLKKARSPGLVESFIVLSLVWLFLTLLSGLSMASGVPLPLFPAHGPGVTWAHAHLGFVGVFTNLIVGVSFRLVPMFILSAIRSPHRVLAVLILLNLGAAVLFSGLAYSIGSLTTTAAFLLTLALAVYLWEMGAILRHRTRRIIDPAIKIFLSSLLWLVPVFALGWHGLMKGWNPPEINAYGFLILFGFVTMGIVGMMYKILPFLVWHHTYSPLIGKRPLPSLNELFSSAFMKAGMIMMSAGLTLGLITMLLSLEFLAPWSAAFWMGGSLTFGVNAFLILRHWFPARPASPITNPTITKANPS